MASIGLNYFLRLVLGFSPAIDTTKVLYHTSITLRISIPLKIHQKVFNFTDISVPMTAAGNRDPLVARVKTTRKFESNSRGAKVLKKV